MPLILLQKSNVECAHNNEYLHTFTRTTISCTHELTNVHQNTIDVYERRSFAYCHNVSSILQKTHHFMIMGMFSGKISLYPIFSGAIRAPYPHLTNIVKALNSANEHVYNISENSLATAYGFCIDQMKEGCNLDATI